MLTDVTLKNLKPKPYNVADRDGMYVHVSLGGSISIRLEYRLNSRRETVTFGRYGAADWSLARARKKCSDARRVVADGRLPAQEKQREKRRMREAKSFGESGENWLQKGPMADNTRAMRRSVFAGDLRPAWQRRLLAEILSDDLRALCAKIVERGAPAIAIQVRDIVKQIFGFAILHGERVPNPADEGIMAEIGWGGAVRHPTMAKRRSIVVEPPMAADGHWLLPPSSRHARRVAIRTCRRSKQRLPAQDGHAPAADAGAHSVQSAPSGDLKTAFAAHLDSLDDVEPLRLLAAERQKQSAQRGFRAARRRVLPSARDGCEQATSCLRL